MVNTDNRRTFWYLPVAFFKVASYNCSEVPGEVADAANMDRDVVFFGSAGKREGVILPYGYLRTAQEDVLWTALALRGICGGGMVPVQLWIWYALS